MVKRQEKKITLTPEQMEQQKLMSRIRLKALFRQALENADWLSQPDDTTLGENVRRNVAVLLRTKNLSKGQSLLSIEEKSIMRKSNSTRTEEERQMLNRILGGLRCFRRYPKKVSKSLASAAHYLYLKKGRILVRENNFAQSLYFLLQGELQVQINRWDDFDGVFVPHDHGTMKAGDMIGEVAMLHNVPRTASAIALTDCELLAVHKRDYDAILTEMVFKKWTQIEKAMQCFTYFKDLDEVAIRECCILAKVRKYGPTRTILGDGRGTPHVAYFVLSGTCRLMERIQVEVTKIGRKEFFKRYIPPPSPPAPSAPTTSVSATLPSSVEQKEIKINGNGNQNKPEDKVKVAGSVQSVALGVMEEDAPGKISPAQSIKSTQQTNGINGDMKQNEATENSPSSTLLESLVLDKQPDGTTKKSDIRTVFMQLAFLNRGSVFGLGETMNNRAIVSKDTVVCLLIPRYWLSQHHSQSWGRIMHFMNSYVPDPDHVFKKFISDRRWREERTMYRTSILSDIEKTINTSIHDVPYATRMDEEEKFAFMDTSKFGKLWDDRKEKARRVTSTVGASFPQKEESKTIFKTQRK